MDLPRTFTDSFIEFVQTNRLFAPGDSLVLAVSGGIDSMVMLDLFVGLRSQWQLEIAVAHVNHQLRGEESMDDEEFVRKVTERCSLPFYCNRIDVSELMHSTGLSKQEVGRQARYEFFDRIRRQTSSTHTATAHQADDNAETVLMNVLRGTGVRGLAGIPLMRLEDHVVRPMLFARREAILSYAQEKRIQFRNDSSNESLAYTRNYLRHRVVPLLRTDLGMDVSESLNRVSSAMKEFSRFLDDLVTERSSKLVRSTDGGYELFIPELNNEPHYLREEIILRTLRQLCVEPRASKIRDVLGLCSGQSGHLINLSSQSVAYRDHDLLVLGRRSTAVDFLQRVSLGETYHFKHFDIALGKPGPLPTSYPNDKLTEYVDWDKVSGPLMIRHWNRGDWFIPLGMKGKKKLSDFFSDQKISVPEKNKIPVLVSIDGIVWICGKRLDDRVKITESTRQAVKLSYSPNRFSDN